MSEINDFLDGKQSSEIDSFLGPDTPKPSGAIRRIADQGIKLAQGVVGVPEAAVGVADLVTGGRAGKLAESSGVRFKDAKQIMGEYLSPEQKAADQEVAQAEGFLPTVGAMVRNPSTIAGSVMESAPSMIGGGAAARGLLKVAPKLGAIAAGAAGEGLVSAGQNAEQVRQESATGLLTPEQSAVLAASGAMTGGISLASGKLANKLGIGDVQTMLASGKLGPVGAEATAEAAKKGVIRKLGEGVLNEGVLQELPQSYQEQVAQNIAQGKPWDEGAAKAGAQGMLAGAAMGGGANVVSHVGERAPETAPVPEPTPEPAPPALQIGNTPDPYLSFPDGTVARRSEIDAYINGLPADQQPAARAKMMGLAPQPAAPEPAPIKPSEAMGLDPAAGPMSAAAVTAVDTGAHQEIQLQQASEADQAAYEQATAEQDRQAEELDTATKPITHGPIAEAAMSDDDKRAVLFSNKAVADGGIQHKGTLDGDILNGLGKPYPNRLAAARRANMEGKDWTIAQVKDGFVARRKDANGPSTEVQSGDTGSTGGRSTDSPASVGVGATNGNGVGAQPRRSPDAVLDQAGQLPKRTDAAPLTATTNAQPTTLGKQTTATAGPGFTAKDVTRVQNAAPRADTTPAAQAVEAPAVVESNAAASEGLPNAGSASVEGGGVNRQDSEAVAYELPEKVSEDWGGTAGDPNTDRTPRQKALMAVVANVLDEGKSYNTEVDARVAELLNLPKEVLSRNRSNVEGGDFGYDVYLARKAIEAQRANKKSKDIAGVMSLKVGDVVGTIVTNDGKRSTGMTVTAVSESGLSFTLEGKRGVAKVRGTMGVDAIQAGINRAKGKGARKDGYDEFVAQKSTKAHQPQEQPNGPQAAQAITPTPQREAQAPDASQRLTPAQAGKLQEAHKAHGLDVTLQTVQRMHDRVMKSLITGKGSNGGVEYNIKPKERKELQAQADRLANDLSLFGVQQEAASPASAPVAPKSLREVVERKRAEKAKPAEQPAEQPKEAAAPEAPTSRPGEPTAEQIESVGDVVRITKSAGKEIKRTVNARDAMKTLNERAEALQILAKACK